MAILRHIEAGQEEAVARAKRQPKASKTAKTNDYDLRRLVVTALLDHGIPREAIRHEITLDTSSSDGRADIVVALDQELIGIELKSGKDKLDRLETQGDQYRRRFDRMCLVVDARHFPQTDGYSENSRVTMGFYRLGFDRVAVVRSGQIERAIGCHRDLPWGEKCGWDVRHGPNDKQAPAAMLSLLWASETLGIAAELVQDGKIPAAASKGARCRIIPHLAEHSSISLLRPRIAARLRERQLNRWEEAFWAKFDAGAVQ